MGPAIFVQPSSVGSGSRTSAPGRTRTSDHLLRRQLLCPTELQGLALKATPSITNWLLRTDPS